RRPPMQLTLSGDASAEAGGRATVTVTMTGEDDGTATTIAVYLRRLGWDAVEATKWPLADLPAAFGAQTVDVELPTGLAPSCARYCEYAFCADVRRSEGRGVTAAAAVTVHARREDLYWPDGPRAGGEITIECDDAVVIGGVLTGSVDVAGDVELEIGPELDTLVGVAGGKAEPRFLATARVTLSDDRSFAVPIGDVVPPTLYDGHEIAIVWQVRARQGDRTGWRAFGVLDPGSRAAARDPKLLTFLAQLARDRWAPKP
ncbi:MAG: hypothetical protein QOF76_4433, partial [Solirubrobacteraceae bacterium]|nr:hypothetical protein [Solirubrobacteraceae bacterium]